MILLSSKKVFKITFSLLFGQFSYIFPETKLTHFFFPNVGYYHTFAPKKWFTVDITLIKVSFVKSQFSLIFGQFSYTLPKSNSPIFFYPNFVIILYLYQIGGSNWDYFLRNKFRKITLFLNFRSVFIHFAQNQTHPFFLHKFRYFLIFELNKWFLVDITLFKENF